MPTPTKGNRLGGSPAHQRIILGNLASQLFEHGAVVTTETKAKRLRPVAERLIAKAKKGDIHNRRQVRKTITDTSVLHALFTEIAPLMAERDGGFTRVIKLGPRKGDNAPMAKIELVTEPVAPKASAATSTTTGSAEDLKAAVAEADEEPQVEGAPDVVESDEVQVEGDVVSEPQQDEAQAAAEADAQEAAADDADADAADADAADTDEADTADETKA